MAVPDVNLLFGRAEAAFAAGRAADARRLLGQVARLTGPHPAVFHLTALVEQKLGASAAALQAFDAARKLAPGDAQIANNHGNLLDAIGRRSDAIRSYGDAIRLTPNDPNVRINRAMTLHKSGDLLAARADFSAALKLDPNTVRGLTAWAALERQAGELDRAAELYDRALLLSPALALARHGRAAVAAGRGEPDAPVRYRQVLALLPDDPEVLMGLAEALDAAGDPDGRATLARAVATNPDWIDGHETLSRMHADVGEPIDGSYIAAIEARPRDRALRQSHWRTLVHAERHTEALAAIDAARDTVGEDRTMRLEEAAIASQAGDLTRAEQALSGLGEAGDVLLVRGRLALRAGRPDAAARALEAAVAHEPKLVTGWAHLALAWRLLDDARTNWLCGQSGLCGAIDLEYSDRELSVLADVLRTLHRSRLHPLGQSLRGGTQTRGRLFARLEPEIRSLAARLADAISGYVDRLPPVDPTHPLLQYRDRRFTFAGSWSVRLRDQGRHINHIHPQGIISSACYIALPTEPGADANAGWLEIGRPPTELGLPLEALAQIEPIPGRLALFPSYLFHGTKSFDRGERLTVAFDLVPR